jgi:hypothetical protein
MHMSAIKKEGHESGSKKPLLHMLLVSTHTMMQQGLFEHELQTILNALICRDKLD